MIENKELYTYIIHSLDVLNRSITISEQNNIKVFSYIYNNQNNIIKDIKSNNINYQNLILKHNNNENQIDENKKQINDLEKRVLKLNNVIKNYETKLNNLESQLKGYDTNIIEVPLIIDNEQSKISLAYNYVKNLIISLYNKCYKIIFKKKIQRELEEQERLFRQQELEKQKREDIERKKRIKEILKTTIKH